MPVNPGRRFRALIWIKDLPSYHRTRSIPETHNPISYIRQSNTASGQTGNRQSGITWAGTASCLFASHDLVLVYSPSASGATLEVRRLVGSTILMKPIKGTIEGLRLGS